MRPLTLVRGGFHPINYDFLKSQYRKWRLSKSTASTDTPDMYTITRGDGESTF